MSNLQQNCSERPLLNTAEAIDRFGGDSDFYYEILEEYVQQNQFDGQKTRKLVSAGKNAEAASEIHRFKGLSGTAGAERLYDTCRQAEEVLRGTREGTAETEIAAVEHVYKLTKVEISKTLQK